MFTRVLVLCLISVSNLSFAQAKQAVSSQSAVYCIFSGNGFAGTQRVLNGHLQSPITVEAGKDRVEFTKFTVSAPSITRVEASYTICVTITQID